MISSVPIYDYRCDECGHRFSAVQSFSDGPLDKCPNCGKKPRRLITAPAIVFKGGGWYKTDSRGAAPKDGDPAAKPVESATKDATSDAGSKQAKTEDTGSAKSDTTKPAATATTTKSEPKS